MFNYNVYTPARMPHEHPHPDWHDNIYRHTIDFGTLSLYSRSEDGEEFVRAVYPNGGWVKIRVIDQEQLGRAQLGNAGINHHLPVGQAIPNDF